MLMGSSWSRRRWLASCFVISFEGLNEPVKNESTRLTVASECNDFVVLGLCQRVQRTPCESNTVVTSSPKWVSKSHYVCGQLKRSTDSDSLIINSPPLPLHALLRVLSRYPEPLQNCTVVLQDTIWTLVWMSGLRFSLHQYAIISPRITIKDLSPVSHHMLQISTPSAQVHFMSKKLTRQTM